MQKTWISSGRKRLNTSMMASNFNGHCLFRPGGGGVCLSCSTQLVSHGTKFYIHDHDMGGFRCKYIYFDTGPPEPMKKWWLSKKRGRGERWAYLIFDFIFQNKFQREEYFVCMTFYTYSLDLCFTWMYRTRGKRKTC